MRPHTKVFLSASVSLFFLVSHFPAVGMMAVKSAKWVVWRGRENPLLISSCFAWLYCTIHIQHNFNLARARVRHDGVYRIRKDSCPPYSVRIMYMLSPLYLLELGGLGKSLVSAWTAYTTTLAP